jgi:beta-glucosidase
MGRPLALEWENQNCAAILETWFAGTAAGYAIVDVLTGKQNPSGKLTMTFPRNVGQIPIYYNAKNTGRPFDAGNKYTSKYLDVDNTPLYPFGFGLSYTSFNYTNVTMNATSLARGGSIQVSATVTNTGSMAGYEVVQFYIHDKVRSLTPPKKELKHFERVSLQPGESKTVKWTIAEKDLSFWNSALQWIAEPGEFELFVGGSSDIPLSATFTLLP